MASFPIPLPEDCCKQWDILLLLLSSEEKKIDRTFESEIDTMSYFLGNEGVRRILLQWLRQMHATYAKKTSDMDTALKCDRVSLMWRQQGNEMFRVNLVEESYKCYAKSVVYATHNGPMYTLALANRSAALLRMKRLKECLADIALAIKYGYPIEQKHKLLLRRADCLMEMNQQPLARLALKDASEHAAFLTLTPAQAAEFDRHVKLLRKKCEGLLDVDPTSDDEVLLECYKGSNPDFVAASSAVELRRNETAGRFVVTNQATARGDILFSEEPYAWVTLPGDICVHCVASPINCVPCATCSCSLYCSEECTTLANEQYHQWECVGEQSKIFTTIGIAHLALRVLLMSASKGFPELQGVNVATANELFAKFSDIDNIKIYHKDTHPFFRMFNLVTNFEKMNNTDYTQYAITATVITLYLETFTNFMSYLPTRLPVAPGQARLFTASLVLRSIGQLVCNGHAALSLATIDDGHGRTVLEKELRKATAIYPSAAMMNHSCDPNIINTFYNRRLIIRSAHELSEGAEVLNCYGPHKAREPSARRKAQLRAQYMFTCTCDACEDPARKDFVLLFSAYACQACKSPVVYRGYRPHCPQCKVEFQLERALATIDMANEIMAEADQAEDLGVRCERTAAALRLRQQVWHRHHSTLRSSVDKLSRALADIGEFGRSIELIKQNIQSLEYQFGSFSVEVAHELRKLSDVMLERIISSPNSPQYREWCLEAHKIIKKAVQLMELTYGSWEPLVKRLKKQETIVATCLAESRAPSTVDCVHYNLHYNLKI